MSIQNQITVLSYNFIATTKWYKQFFTAVDKKYRVIQLNCRKLSTVVMIKVESSADQEVLRKSPHMHTQSQRVIVDEQFSVSIQLQLAYGKAI